MSNFSTDPLRLGEADADRLSIERWNGLVDELRRTQQTLNRIHLGEGETVRVGIGTGVPQAKLHLLHETQDANGDALILGPRSASNLRLGYHQNYSWVQSHGSKPLAINPKGNNVGIRTTDPQSPLHVNGRIESSKDGFKFPDKSVQKTAVQQTVIRMGSVTMTKGGYLKSPLGKGTGHRSYTSPVITVTGFSRKPQITFSVSHIDAHRNANLRLKTQIVELKIGGSPKKVSFRVEFSTWSDTIIYNCVVRWMAVGV